jgi:nucleoside-diphosphate-sugar epimerase
MKQVDWDPVSKEEAYTGPLAAYRASKTFAERAAWEFVAKEKATFELSVCNPPLVLGPIVHYLNTLDNINTSNARVRDMLKGTSKEKLPPSGNHLWVDVRDIATAHVLAMEKPEAGGHRFFVTQGNFCNREIVDIIKEEFPQYRAVLPDGEATKSGDYPAAGVHGWNNKQSVEVLGVTYRPLRESIVDTVRSLQPLLETQ